jgi:hypothetical protein
MTTTLQESQKEKESNSHKEKESDIDSITTIRTAKKNDVEDQETCDTG